MGNKRKSGQRQAYDVKGWATVPFRIPKEMLEAVRIQSSRKNLDYMDYIRGLLESYLQKSGILQVIVTLDSSQRPIKSYELTGGHAGRYSPAD
jgi:hypothetical protein